MPKERQRRQISDTSISNSMKRVKRDPVSYYLSTGSTLLDLAVSDRYPGGVGGGRVTHLYGDNSTAKTLLLQEILGACQRMGGTAVLADAEWAFDYPRAELFGLKVGRWEEEEYQRDQIDGETKAFEAETEKSGCKERLKYYTKQLGACSGFLSRHPRTVEELFDVEIAGLIQAVDDGLLKPPIVLGVDSLSALSSNVERAADLDKGTYGMSRAKAYSAGFRKYLGDMATHGVTMVAIDQTRENVGISFGDKKTTSGGKAMGFYATTRILLTSGGYIEKTEGIKTGVQIKFLVKKNKLAAPFRNGIIRIVFDLGVDDVASNLEWLKECKIDGKLDCNGSWWSWDGKSLGQGLDKSTLKIESEDLMEALEQEVTRVWRKVYAPSVGRKKRHG